MYLFVSKMATEAQRLIGISLSKIAQSRGHRGGVSLHKNLLVATVLQKARFIFMEEAYHMVHAGNYCRSTPIEISQRFKQSYSLDFRNQKCVDGGGIEDHNDNNNNDHDDGNEEEDDDNLVALTPEEAGISSTVNLVQETTTNNDGCNRCTANNDKENLHPNSYHNNGTIEFTYLDLDKSSLNTVLRDRYRQKCANNSSGSTCLKRRRAITEWETEEAVLSILPKKSKQSVCETGGVEDNDDDDDDDDSVFVGESTLLSDCVARETMLPNETAEQEQVSLPNGQSMEIDRITSLVSIFSFGSLSVGASTNNKNNADNPVGKMARSVSTPDLCSSQAKEAATNALQLQQRSFITMTV